MVRPDEFESPTPWFVAKYSIQLSYGRFLKRHDYMTKTIAEQWGKENYWQLAVAAAPEAAQDW